MCTERARHRRFALASDTQTNGYWFGCPRLFEVLTRIFAKAVMFVVFLCVTIVNLSWISADPCSLPLPKSYVVYQLDTNESIEVDGKLDDDSWLRVGWTDSFMGKRPLA